MMSSFKNIFRKLKHYLTEEDLRVSKWDEPLLAAFCSYNSLFCMLAAAMLCILTLIGFIGTYAPYSTGAIIPAISAAAVYMTILVANLYFLGAIQYIRLHPERFSAKKQRRLFAWFTGINMVLASATFFTTQENSSFFFEYILVTSIVYLVPNAGMAAFCRNMVLNLASASVVLAVSNHPIAWQDVVDIAALHLICAFINRLRLQSFVHETKERMFIEKQKEEFYQDSRTDELTHIANRTALRGDFSKFQNEKVCAALIDLDFFKQYNDTYGHAYGDKVLERMGRNLNRVFGGEKDHCYRYGGDEFLIITEGEDGTAFRKRLENFRNLCAQKEDGIDIICSIGYCADLPQSGQDMRDIIRSADGYLYQAKSEGSGHIRGGGRQKEEKGTPLQAGLDSLTGLPDMRSFFASMRKDRARERDVSRDGELAALFFDLVNFRMINLLYGMSYGDDTLRRMGQSLQESFPEGVVSHWDVDHFAVLTDTRDLDKRVDQALAAINAFLPVHTECSIGACVWKDHSLDAETICNRARAACDENRKKVGVHFSYYTDDIGQALNTDVYVVSHIDEAIEKGWIVVYYQPIVRALSNQICGMEALARWKDPEKGLLPPISFVEPLEDAKQIHKLDLCVIRQTVQLIADRYAKNLPEIPVSVNLSRLDFLCCDIYQEIENLVMQYDIPRRMLHIEVTESIMRSEDGAILRALQSFRSSGYELWMDDFGSGYSTLNLLKDYSFDLLKLDMAFLRSDSPRSRDIIVSVIEMDKRLGIRTLAEGVETKEQAEFLKKSGCEKLQGYYFGRPMPFEEALKNCLDKGIGVENAQQKICYDALGHVNFLTDIPLLISEMEGSRIELLFANEPEIQQLTQDGFKDLKDLENNLNDPHNVASRELMKAVNQANSVNDRGEITSFFSGNRRLLRYQMLGSHDGKRLYRTHIYGRTAAESSPAFQNEILMNLTYFYRHLYSIETSDMTIQSLRFVSLSMAKSDREPVRSADGHYASVLPLVFEADARRYAAFLDTATMVERLEKAEYGILRGVFRTQAEDGTYVWMSHRLLLVPNAGNRKILYAIRMMDGLDEAGRPSATLRREVLLSTGTEEDTDRMGEAEIFESLVRHSPLPFFWKDRNRRFIGASQAFLDYYGLSSEEEIQGKTDEDMGWHLNNETYQDDEDQVLSTGQLHRNVPGRCVSKGVPRTIYATKWPTYHDGKISGLMGYFLDSDMMSQGPGEIKNQKTGETDRDRWSVIRLLEGLSAYVTDYQLNGRNFGLVYVEVPELTRIGDRFGQESMRKVKEACIAVMRDALNHSGYGACPEVGLFVNLMTLQQESDLEKVAEKIRSGINAIHEVDGIPCSLYAKVRAMDAAEAMRMNEHILDLVYPKNPVAEKTGDKESASKELKALLPLMDQMPIGSYVLKPDHTVLYWSPEAQALLGFSSQEMKGKKCIDMPLGCSFTNGERVPTQFCPAVVACRTGKPHSLQMFMRRKDGTDLLVRNIIMPLKDENGEVSELLSFFIPLADQQYDPDMIRDLYQAATRDPLTCLPGRKYMEACLQDEMEKYRRTGNPFAVLFADADCLHETNNTYGHEAGDALLREIGLMLRKYGRKADRFCRWGGDEFVGLLQIRNPEDIEGAGLRFKAASEKCEIDVNGKMISCQSAIGITVVREGDTVNSLVDRADQYMYEAKKIDGKQIVTDFSTGKTKG